MAVISIAGCYDLHVHTGPSPFKRVGDTIEIGRWCAEAGMAGIVSKVHLDCSVARAYHANKALAEDFPEFRVYGAVCLNRAAGGINPAAAEVALDQGGKVVWFPTFDSAHHAETFGGAGNYGTKGTTVTFKGSRQRGGYKAIDANGKLSGEAKEVVEIIAAYDGILATGHISVPEVIALFDYSQKVNLKRFVVTHPDGKVPGLDLAGMVDLARGGAFMEFVATHSFPFVANVSSYWRREGVTGPVQVEELLELCETIGYDRCLISTDGGHIVHPRPDEVLRSLLQSLHERGLSEVAIDQMCRQNPAWLLGIEKKAPRRARGNGKAADKAVKIGPRLTGGASRVAA